MPNWLRRAGYANPLVSIPVRYKVTAIYQVYFVGAGSLPPDPAALLKSSAASRDDHVSASLIRGMSELWDRYLFHMQVARVEELPFQPPIGILRHTGLGELEERVLGAATHGVVLGCGDLNTPPRLGLWSALALALAVAAQLDGVIFDPDALRILNRKSAIGWFNELALIAASQHIVVPFSTGHGNGLGLMTTRGMEKFGLPDLELRDVPLGLDKLAVMMTAVAQFLVESVLRTAVERKAEIASVVVPAEISIDRALFHRAHGSFAELDADSSPLVHVGLNFDPKERAPDPPMIRLVPPRGESDPGVWLHMALRALMDGTDEVRRLRREEADVMHRAHERAMAELPQVKHRFADGFGAGEVLYVKHGFDTPLGGREFLWMAVSQWSNGRLVGQIVNNPHDVPSLMMGETVTVNEDDLFDWMLALPGGRSEGGYTDEVARQQGRQI